tara:strand:+ start:300 stop:614 length:315 start_codon:yes stop_codon:yes gene_type:complete
MFKNLFKKKSSLKPKSALKRFRKHNKDGTVKSVLPNRVTDAYGHTFGPKTGRKRKAPVTRGPLRNARAVKVEAPKVKDERKPKKRSSVSMGSGRYGLFRMFRKK